MCQKHWRDRAGKSWEDESVWQWGLNEFLIPRCVASLFLTPFLHVSLLFFSPLPSHSGFYCIQRECRRQMTSGFHGNQLPIKWNKQLKREGSNRGKTERWRARDCCLCSLSPHLYLVPLSSLIPLHNVQRGWLVFFSFLEFSIRVFFSETVQVTVKCVCVCVCVCVCACWTASNVTGVTQQCFAASHVTSSFH